MWSLSLREEVAAGGSKCLVIKFLARATRKPTMANQLWQTNYGKPTLRGPGAGVRHHLSDKAVLLALTKKRGLE